jgi:hypothetical protein
VRRGAVVVLLPVLFLVAGAASTTNSPAAAPLVTGPVTGGKGSPTLVTATFDPADAGYTRAEYFLEGTATAYTSDVPLTTDGRWTVHPQSTAPYKTRIVVYRPARAKDFNGTVFVEWANVSAGADTGTQWGTGHNAALRDGAAWVVVSAQAVGIQGGQTIIGESARGGLRAADPVRYDMLWSPGDSYSYDMYAQAGVVARNRTTPRVLGNLKVQHVIATGQSQSAFRLVTYINALARSSDVFDGYLVHSRNARGSALSSPPLAAVSSQVGTIIRTDLDVPVFILQTESDLTLFNAITARQPDTKLIRTWEGAGASHADFYQGAIGFGDLGDGAAERKMLDVASADGGPLRCAQPINQGPQYLLLNAAIHHLGRWVADGVAPPRAASIEMNPGPPPVITRDFLGNALGGVRTPVVDVPIATLRGDGNAGGSFCYLFGSTVPFDAATLATLYPSHRDYVTRFGRATDAAARRGFVLPKDAEKLKAAAAATTVGGA